ncbi:hypothetical protein GALMADRAFT_208044 [Galerina marginata CBS 339.88]|uniref:DEAD/DEAH-box helicase domain-containing protein n=1 Tax=Galerina marginata (strain CBS 339.88) TaxID=685588 RepID=A0A067TQI2_GALM3|nr:hypothetical protein GALMADRAFT_208044 [Galerina marginata CBS 339.88]
MNTSHGTAIFVWATFGRSHLPAFAPGPCIRIQDTDTSPFPGSNAANLNRHHDILLNSHLCPLRNPSILAHPSFSADSRRRGQHIRRLVDKPRLRNRKLRCFTCLKLVSGTLDGTDIFCCTATGDGKSAAFTIPCLVLLEYNKNPESYPQGLPTRAKPTGVVITPTKGLANDIVDELSKLNVSGFSHCAKTLTEARKTGVCLAEEVKECNRCKVLCVDPGQLRDKEWREITESPTFRSNVLFACVNEAIPYTLDRHICPFLLSDTFKMTLQIKSAGLAVVKAYGSTCSSALLCNSSFVNRTILLNVVDDQNTSPSRLVQSHPE